MIIRKTNNTIEILEGGEELPEGEAVQVWTKNELKRRLGLDHYPDTKMYPVEGESPLNETDFSS